VTQIRSTAWGVLGYSTESLELKPVPLGPEDYGKKKKTVAETSKKGGGAR